MAARSLQLLPTYLRAATVRRSDVFFSALGGVIPLLLATVWLTVGRRYHVPSLRAGIVVPYYVRVAATSQLTAWLWIAGQLGDEIRDGTLVSRLTRPVHPYLELGLRELCRCSVRCIPFALVLLVASFSFYAGEPLASVLVHLLLYLPSLLASFALSYGISFAIGSLGFWFSDVHRLTQLFLGTLFVLGGWLSPTSSVLPAALRASGAYLPFRLLLAAPVKALDVTTPPATVAANLGLTLAWAAAVGLLAGALWRQGLRRYEGGGR